MELIMKFRNLIYLTAFVFLAFSQIACEDIVEVDVEQKQKKLVVDAFIDNQLQTQTIRLTESIPFFDLPGTEPPVTTATVVLADTSTGKIFPFIHDSMGYYRWNPNEMSGDTLTVGSSYALFIIENGDTVVGITKLYPTADRIDSLRTVPTKGNGPPFIDTGRYCEIFAYDLPGIGNHYWLKTFRNDTLLSDINNLNIAQDMGNNSNGQDGDLFIYPVRFSQLNEFLRPYVGGEKVRVEIHSISREAYYWFQLIVNESNNGGLFATPPVNIMSNLFYINQNPKRGIAGFFNVAAVNAAEITVVE
ncbi:MAG: DUF4249 domain-containing protein [Bacteroidia bacterium]|jgi:hypothetical protein|nr:DUF4249 domain-containing protein [Bacteroidia bacterium]